MKAQRRTSFLRVLFLISFLAPGLTSADSIVPTQFPRFSDEGPAATQLPNSPDNSLDGSAIILTVNNDIGDKAIGPELMRTSTALDRAEMAASRLVYFLPWELRASRPVETSINRPDFVNAYSPTGSAERRSSRARRPLSPAESLLVRSASPLGVRFGTGLDENGRISNNLKALASAVRPFEKTEVANDDYVDIAGPVHQNVFKTAWRLFRENPILAIVVIFGVVFILRVVLS